MTGAAPSVAVIDTGAGNLLSVVKALELSGARPRVVEDLSALSGADALVLPGVGAFAAAAQRLAKRGLDDAVRNWIARGRPYLGLCLGLQLLFEESDEHERTPGLGVLKGAVRRFPPRTPAGDMLRVPHIGWNAVRWSDAHPVSKALPGEAFYYFVHAHRVEAASAEGCIGRAEYGTPFAAAVARENVFAVQFHPEKSQGAGRRLLEAFTEWVRS